MSKRYRVEKHKYTVIGEVEEIYPETGEKLIRPNINYLKVLGCLLLTELITVALTMLSIEFVPFIGNMDIHYAWKFVILHCILSLITAIVFSEKIVIFIIRLYQRYGSYEIRSKCLFVPNCSEYMALAVQKYGTIKGIKMGIKRFKRCCEPNGGVDYP